MYYITYVLRTLQHCTLVVNKMLVPCVQGRREKGKKFSFGMRIRNNLMFAKRTHTCHAQNEISRMKIKFSKVRGR